MFHSSSSRHEQYLIRSNPSRATLHKKRSSLESEISGADSGYTSSSSTPSSTSPTTATACSPTTTIATASTDSHVTTAKHDVVTVMPPPPTVKKKKSKRHQPPRQPDLVYSCPRPLAFPFHNDDHFLPIAEADPRDVARVSPSLNRSSSLQSSKTSIGSTRMYENYSYSGNTSQRGLDTESSYSHQSSILSTIQRGTVRSIRSLFQLPESQSHSRDLSRVQTNNTTKTNYTGSASSTHPPLQKLEIKKGTVQSIKDMFTLKRSNIQVQHVTQPPPRQQKGRVGATIGQFESSSSPINYSRASIAAASSKKNNSGKPPTAALKMNVTPPAPSQPKSLKSRAAEFASRAIWKPKEPKLPTAYTTPATKPLPKDPTDKKTLKSEVKKISARVMALPKKWTSSTTATSAPPVSLPAPVTEAPKSKRSLFSSFRRSDVSASVDSSNHKKKGVDVATTQDEITPPRASTTVGKMWKSFKSLVTGKKSSRIGVL
ncbi:hypothetical protein V8B55DRAFT_1517516 [Mucor lusitanicus]|uniref:Uncharacterized protein n=2 Tax=Mucor circinelloides f. lusitanicus TaxID=29924 RepID=A0A168L5U6_MUCCL|nr:hypothetical protein FB192DRAFT_1399014 [Mucor lusitanicus]OAD03143.1 hypothetical protein MUCCIDRAFT_162738 [Mucor lusitanicus CBS 277.49]